MVDGWVVFSSVFTTSPGISAFAPSWCNPILLLIRYCFWDSEALVWKLHMGNDGDGWLLVKFLRQLFVWSTHGCCPVIALLTMGDLRCWWSSPWSEYSSVVFELVLLQSGPDDRRRRWLELIFIAWNWFVLRRSQYDLYKLLWLWNLLGKSMILDLFCREKVLGWGLLSSGGVMLKMDSRLLGVGQGKIGAMIVG